MYPSAIATTLPATTNEENFEFDLDFIAAATEAAVESSVAYVLGMRSHEGASTATAKATAYAEGFDSNFEYDLIVAAIHTTVEKELREATEEAAGGVAQSRIAPTFTQPSMAATKTMDYEFEFLESLAESEDEAESEAAATSFTVYPSVPLRATTATDHPRVGKRSKYFCFF